MILTIIRKRLKLFSILSSILLLIPTPANLHACSYNPEVEELRYMVFNPDLLGNKSWWSFFYNGKLNYLDGTTFSADDEDILVREWMNHVKTKAAYDEVFNCIFGSLSDSLLSENKFFKDIQQDPAAKEYFTLARSSENVTDNITWWDDSDDKKEEINREFSLTTTEIQKHLLKEKSPFYKKKYAFQLPN